MWKMSIQYTALGFEPTTFRTWVSFHNHQTRDPAQRVSILCSVQSFFAIAVDLTQGGSDEYDLLE